MIEGNPTLSDHWRFRDFGDDASKYHKYGWTGKLGNYGLRDDTFQLRFNLYSTNNDGTYTLQVVYPYENVAATEGLKEQVNAAWDNAHYKIDFIWHRMAMTSLVRDTTVINPEMPFAARDFAGKWKWSMNNLTCGTDVNGNPIAVDNSWGNKGKFLAMFSFATQAQYPEFAEAFLTLREPACIVDVPVCSSDPGYPAQSYSSANDTCATEDTTLTFTPVLNGDTGTYEIPLNSIRCNGMVIFHSAITGTSSLATLVAQMNSYLSAMGTWAVSGGDITLTGANCTTVNLPWTDSD
jgi:hypothetical protein